MQAEGSREITRSGFAYTSGRCCAPGDLAYISHYWGRNVSRVCEKRAQLYLFVVRYITPEARPLHERALAVYEKALGPDHPNVAMGLNNLAATLSDLGRHAEALALQERALRIHETAYGPDHPATRRSRQYVEQLKPVL